MNNISGSIFYAKLKELIPNLSNSLSQEVINKLCEDDSVQSFLKWFCVNINSNNVLSDTCIKMRDHIKKNDSWLQGEELDLAVAEATKNCPELLKLIESNYWNNNQSLSDFTVEKDLYDSDFEYLQLIENSLRKLKEYEDQIDNDVDQESDVLKKEDIKLKLIYENCITILEDFDSCHRQFFTAIELLTNTYINTTEKKGEPCLWTQVPLELYIKQLETYNDYLNSYAKRQFSISHKEEGSESITTHTSFMNDSGENEKLNELINCQKNLFTSKLHEIIAKVEDDASKCLVNYSAEIYNNGSLKVPSTPVLARAEIAELTKTRDFLEENVNLLQEQQLVDAVQQFSKIKIIKVLEEEAETRLQRRQDRFLRLEKLCTLAKKHGHAFTTLLCMLLELQIHRINEIIKFILDARHYLSMEYSLSSLRNSSMKTLQTEYKSILESPKEQNSFCKKFIEMAGFENAKDEFRLAVQYYDDLRNDNSNKLEILLGEKLVEAIESTKLLETKVTDLYNEEISRSPTSNFKAVPFDVQNQIDKTVKQIEELEINVESIRNKLKNMIKETNAPSYEREKLLLWQKFLADPQSLQTRYKELEDLQDQAALNFKNN